ncbi:MAG: serine hydrolase domain-containing protein [Bacteroidales bacterium]
MIRLFSKFAILILTFKLSGQALEQDRFIAHYAKDHNFNGTILIQSNSKITYQKSFGFANFQFKVPHSIETKYKIASITKLFTSVLIMQLYDQSKIDLNKPIKTYLPDYKGEGAGKVLICHLLNHTSGMVNIDTISSVESAVKNGVPLYQKPYTKDEFLERYCSDTLVTEPGKVFDYNNADYIVLGKIIERITGKTYEELLNDNILQPLKMKNTGLLHQHIILEGLADTYFYRDDLKQLVNDLPVYIENWYSSGAMYSTTNDLLSFSNALFGLKLVNKESLYLMVTPGLDNYGYGVWINDYEINNKKYTAVKRPGLIMGAQTMLLHFFNPDLTIIILSNTGTTNLDDFVLEISKQIIK